MNAAGAVILILFVLLVVGGIGWVVFTRLRASRLGLPPLPLSSYIPFARSSSSAYGTPASTLGGIRGWISERVRYFKNRNDRSAAGAYEQPFVGRGGGGGAGGSRRGFGPLDPDEAWDARVGSEADAYGSGEHYEEPDHELGYSGNSGGRGRTSHFGEDTSYDGGGGGGKGCGTSSVSDYDDKIERPRSRTRAEGVALPAKNPFDDEAEMSDLRGVSPRPMDDAPNL